MRTGVVWAIGVVIVTEACSAWAATFVPHENKDVLHNPHMGWVYIVNAYPHYTDEGRSIPFLKDGTAWGKVDAVAVLSDWGALEPREGIYDWSLIDRAVEFWSGIGKKIHLRIATDGMITNGRMEGTGGAPAWLYDLGVGKMTREEWGRQIAFPDYTNPLYMARLRAFLKALADHLRPFDSIEAADLRGYGMWGEWHSGHDLPDLDTRARTLRGIINAWSEAFANRPQPFYLYLSTSWEYRDDLLPKGLASRGNPPPTYEHYATGSAFDYAFSLPRIAPRRDGVAGFIYPTLDGRLMHDLWRSQRKPFIAELGGGIAVYEGGQRWGYDLRTALDEALQYNANYVMLCNWDLGVEDTKQDLSAAPPVSFYNTHGDLMDDVLREMGYRLVPVRMDMPESLVAGHNFVVAHTWENRGQGRLPYPYRFELCLERNGKTCWRSVDPLFNPTNIVRGESFRWLSEFSLPGEGLEPGRYDVRIALVDENGKRRIALPLNDGDRLGYRVGSVSLAEAAPAAQFQCERFEKVEPEARAFRIDSSSGQFIENAEHVIRGKRSVRGENNGNAEWREFLDSDPSMLPLKANATYVVSFLYRPLAAHGGTLEDPGFFYLLARTTSGGIADDRGFTRWYDQPEDKAAAKTAIITLGPHDDYRLLWGIRNSGAIAIDDVCVSQVPAGDVVCVADVPTLEAGLSSTGPMTVAYDPATRSPQFSEYLTTNPARLHLKPNTSYTTCFEYESLADPQFGSYAWLKIRAVDEVQETDTVLLKWTQRAGVRECRSVTFVTGPRDDYRLSWGFKNGGSCRLGQMMIIANNETL
ncbi:MAG: DUF4832 domain-containing protein [Candidatus Hydrogenedentales bacterium]|jgi:hypothetical protein